MSPVVDDPILLPFVLSSRGPSLVEWLIIGLQTLYWKNNLFPFFTMKATFNVSELHMNIDGVY